MLLLLQRKESKSKLPYHNQQVQGTECSTNKVTM